MNNQVLVDRELLQAIINRCDEGQLPDEMYNSLVDALATPDPIPDHLPDATKMVAPIPDAGEGVVVVGYLTPYALEVDQRTNDDKPLMTVAQHTRIVSALQASAAVVPDGWRVVPVVPTPKMIKADPYGMGYGRLQAVYHAMLAAAPAPGGGQ